MQCCNSILFVIFKYGPTQPKYSRHEKFDEASLEIDFSISGSARTRALTGSDGTHGTEHMYNSISILHIFFTYFILCAI